MIKEILYNLNGYYREHEKLPRFIEVNESAWDAFSGLSPSCSAVYAIGLIGGVPVIPLESEKDWTFVE